MIREPRLKCQSPGAMREAIARMARTAKKQASAAPPPISENGDMNKDPDKMSIDEWMKWHDEEQAKKAPR